jgi:hypothetical protein
MHPVKPESRVTYSRSEVLAIAKSALVEEASFTLPANCNHLAVAPRKTSVPPVAVVRHAKPSQASLAVLRQIIPDLDEDEIAAPQPRPAAARATEKWGSLRSQPQQLPAPAGSSRVIAPEKSYVAPVVTQVERDALAQIQKQFVQRMRATGAAADSTPAEEDASSDGTNSLLAKLRTIVENNKAEAEAEAAVAAKAESRAAAASEASAAAKYDASGAISTADVLKGKTELSFADAPLQPFTTPAKTAAGGAPSPDGSSTASSPSPAPSGSSSSAKAPGLSAAAKPFVPKPSTPGTSTAPTLAGPMHTTPFSAFSAHASGNSFNFQNIYSQLGPNRPHHHHGGAFFAHHDQPMLGERLRTGAVHYNPLLTKEDLSVEWEKWWCSCGWRFYPQFFAVPIPVAVDRNGKPLMLNPLVAESIRRSAAELAETADLPELQIQVPEPNLPSSRPLPALLGGMGFNVKVVSASAEADENFSEICPPLPAAPPGAELVKRKRSRGGKRRRGKRGGRAARAAREGLNAGNHEYDESSQSGDEPGRRDDGTETDSDEDHYRRMQQGIDNDELGNESSYRELRFRTPDRNDQEQREARLDHHAALEDSPATIASSADAMITESQLLARRARYPIDLTRRMQRERQVALGMRTLGYKVWERMQALHLDMPVACGTPPAPTMNCSKRAWAAVMSKWLRTLFEFDSFVGLVFSEAELLTLPRSHEPEPIPEDLLEDDDDLDSDQLAPAVADREATAADGLAVGCKW